MKKIILFTLLLVAATGLHAQSKVQMRIPDVLAPSGISPICVPIIADSFPNIAGMGFSVTWDSTQIRFDEIRFGANPLDISGSSISQPAANSFAISWLSDDLSGTTLSFGTAIFEVCFTPTANSGFSTLTWEGINPSEFLQEGSITAYPDSLLAGSVNYGDDVALSILPGDTNFDNQVDHRDLLNIGLIHGATGPIRPDASATFTRQTAPRWNNNLADGLNYTFVDSDGNGEINADDLDAVNNFIGRAEAAYALPPDVSAGNGPVLSLELPAVINAGEMNTLKVNLGDGNDANAVGYGLAFTLIVDPNNVELTGTSADFSNSFLGDDLLTVIQEVEANSGRYLIALSRKDRVNTTTPGGEVVEIEFMALNPNNVDSYATDFTLTPNAFLLSDQSTAAINGGTTEVQVQGALATREPAWGAALAIFPNPYTNGPLRVTGDLPAFDGVRVLDLTGRELHRYEGDVRSLDVSALPTGTYLLEVTIAGERVSRRIVKR